MRVINKIFFFVLIVSSINSVAQNTSVALHQDKRLAILCGLKDSINSFRIEKKTDGYRILVITTQDRIETYRLKAKLLSGYNNYSTYLSYQTPFFKLKVGDFLSIREATDVKNNINSKLKLEATVVPDKVYDSRMETAK